MPQAFTTDHTINATPEQVFSVITNLDEFKSWMKGFVRVEKLTPGPVGAGTQFRETRKMFGREATEQFEVRAFEPTRRLSLYVDGTKGSMKKGEFVFEYELVPQTAATLLKSRGHIDCGDGFFANLMMKLMCGTFKKACDKDLYALMAYIESKYK